MFRSKEKSRKGPVDGVEGDGVPLGGDDERPPTGYRSHDDEIDLTWEEEDDAERRRDPLRKP